MCAPLCLLHIEPVVTHAGAVPLAAAGPAPLEPALGPWTLHVHASTVFLNWYTAARAGLGCFLDGFLGGLIPACLLSSFLIHFVGLRTCSRGFTQGAAFSFVVRFLAVPAKDEPTAEAADHFTGDFLLALLRQQPCSTARARAQHTSHLQHTLFSTILLVPVILLFS